MPAHDFFAAKKRVNVLKKVKINGVWKLCPAVVEANGKLRDRVKVNGHVEVHPEGVYFLEWRDNGRRVRESVQDKADVLRRARVGRSTLILIAKLEPRRCCRCSVKPTR